jgi:hypothetical protein
VLDAGQESLCGIDHLKFDLFLFQDCRREGAAHLGDLEASPQPFVELPPLDQDLQQSLDPMQQVVKEVVLTQHGSILTFR